MCFYFVILKVSTVLAVRLHNGHELRTLKGRNWLTYMYNYMNFVRQACPALPVGSVSIHITFVAARMHWDRFYPCHLPPLLHNRLYFNITLIRKTREGSLLTRNRAPSRTGLPNFSVFKGIQLLKLFEVRLRWLPCTTSAFTGKTIIDCSLWGRKWSINYFLCEIHTSECSRVCGLLLCCN
jgi:hypothetical protein